MTSQPSFSEDELEQFAIFALGLAIGFIIFSLVTYLVEEWVIASDQADRRRIREILREMLGSASQEPQAEELERRTLTPAAAQ